MKMISNIQLLFSFVLLIPIIKGQKELVSVHVVFRHGDRAPSYPYPLDPYGIENWPNGWSQLTELGAYQTNELGTFLRQQYGVNHRLVEKSFNPHKVIVRATSKKRAIESARNLLHGLYKPDEHPESIGIKVEGNYNQDVLLKPNSVACDRYEKIAKSENGVLFKAYNLRFASFFKYLSYYTGYEVSMGNVEKVFDAVFRETVHGLAQPSWLNTTFYLDADHPEILVYDTILELKRVTRLSEFNSEWKSKLRTGFLLGDIVQRLQRIAHSLPDANFVLYSSHDATLTSLLYNMGMGNDLIVPYAAAIIFELYKDVQTEAHFVKVLFRNETIHSPYELQVIQNQNVFSLKDFSSTMSNRMYLRKEDYFKDCALIINENNL